jgi:Ca2+-binding RTX toxin-like protein
MAIVNGPWNQDGVDRLSPLISDEYRSYVADKTGITITEFLVKNPFRFKLNISNFKYTLNSRTGPVVTGGDITSITAFTKSGSSWTPRTSLTKSNVSAVSFYKAAMSKDPSDDRRFFESVFKGNDEFNLSDDNDIIRGYAGNDKIYGKAGNDYLDGGIGNDFIDGGLGNDTIIGGLGSDRLTGGRGKDKFMYASISDSLPRTNNRDVLTDFNGKEGDLIDLKAIDAYTKTPGNQAFTYIGSADFTGTKGEVRFSGGVLQMNTGTDKIADMEIALTGVTAFQSSYLIL